MAKAYVRPRRPIQKQTVRILDSMAKQPKPVKTYARVNRAGEQKGPTIKKAKDIGLIKEIIPKSEKKLDTRKTDTSPKNYGKPLPTKTELRVPTKEQVASHTYKPLLSGYYEQKLDSAMGVNVQHGDRKLNTPQIRALKPLVDKNATQPYTGDLKGGRTLSRGIQGALALTGQQVANWTSPKALNMAGAGATTGAIAGSIAPLGGNAFGAGAGALVGLQTGSAWSAYDSMVGRTYKTLRDAGVSDETAYKTAMASGAGEAALEYLQLDELAKFSKQIAKSGDDAAIKTVSELLKNHGKLIAKETAQEVTQEGFQIGAETYAKKKEGIKPDTAKQNINRLKDTAVDSALAFGFMGVPGTVYGGLNINKQPTQKQNKMQKAVDIANGLKREQDRNNPEFYGLTGVEETEADAAVPYNSITAREGNIAKAKIKDRLTLTDKGKKTIKSIVDNPYLDMDVVKAPTVELDDDEILVYRKDEDGNELKGKPQGLFTSPVIDGNAYSMHGNAGSKGMFIKAKVNNAYESKQIRDVIPERGSSKTDLSAPVAALYDLDNKTYKDMIGLNKKGVIEYTEANFPQVNTDRAYDSYEIMERVAAHILRERGYDSVISINPDDPSLDEIILLNDDFEVLENEETDLGGKEVQPVKKPSQIASPPVQNTEYVYDEKSYEDLYNYINSKQEPIIPKKTTPEERIQAFHKDVKDKKEWPVFVRISKEKFNQAMQETIEQIQDGSIDMEHIHYSPLYKAIKEHSSDKGMRALSPARNDRTTTRFLEEVRNMRFRVDSDVKKDRPDFGLEMRDLFGDIKFIKGSGANVKSAWDIESAYTYLTENFPGFIKLDIWNKQDQFAAIVDAVREAKETMNGQDGIHMYIDFLADQVEQVIRGIQSDMAEPAYAQYIDEASLESEGFSEDYWGLIADDEEIAYNPEQQKVWDDIYQEAVSYVGIPKNEYMIMSQPFADISPEQQKVLDIAQKLYINMEYVTFNDNRIQGQWDGQVLRVNAQAQAPLYTVLMHELTHVIEGTVYYNDMLNEAIKHLERKTGRNIVDIVVEKQRALENNGFNADYSRQAQAEVMADYMADLLGNEENLQALARQNGNLAQRIYQWLSDIIQKLSNEDTKILINARQQLGKALNDVANNRIAKPQDIQSLFLGETAKNADLEALEKAKIMTEQNVDTSTIWKDTGWIQGPDGKWRFEISDKDADFNSRRSELLVDDDDLEAPNLSTQFTHNRLYENSPDTKSIKLQNQNLGHADGAYNPESNKILLDYMADSRKATLLHEIQHALQQEYGFAVGTNYQTASEYQDKAKLEYQSLKAQMYKVYQKMTAEIPQDIKNENNPEIIGEFVLDFNERYLQATSDLRDQIQDLENKYGVHTEASKEKVYQNFAGEIEAREVQKRMDMTDEERRNTVPYLGGDEAIIASDVVPQFSASSQEEYFADSKLRDSDGNLKPIYHGTGTTIHSFDPNLTRQGNAQYGPGFYFTTDPEYAKQYMSRGNKNTPKVGGEDNPNVIEAYGNLKNPIIIDANKQSNLSGVKVGKKQAYEILKRLPSLQNELDSDLDNPNPVGDYFPEVWELEEKGKFNKVTKKKYANMFADLHAKEANDLIKLEGFFQDYPLEFHEAVRDILGYDGVVINYDDNMFHNRQQHIVAWFPEQIKDVNNKNPQYSNDIHNMAIMDDVQDPKKVSRLAKRTADSELYNIIGDSLQDKIKSGELDYTVIGDKPSVERAKEKLKNNRAEQLAYEFMAKADANKRITKDDAVTAIGTIQKLVTQGQTELAEDLVSSLSLSATEAGQFIQSLKLLEALSPMGMLKATEKAIGKMNKGKDYTMSDARKEDILNQTTPDGLKGARERAVGEYISSRNATLMEIADAWRYLAMLMNPKTHGRNIYGNALFAIPKGAKNIIGGATEGIVEALGGFKDEDRTKTLKRSDTDTKKFAKADFEVMKNTYLHGNSKENLQNRNVKLPRGLSTLSNINTNALENMDILFMKHHYTIALANYLTANKIDVKDLGVFGQNAKGERIVEIGELAPENKKILDKARNYAITEAKKATYRDYNSVASVLNELKRKNPYTKFAMDAVFPFVSTPLNIVKRGVEYSPVGLANGLKKLAQKARKTDSITTSEVIDTIASGLSGTGVFALGAFLASQGLLSGGDEEDKKVANLLGLEGEQVYSINLGDYTYSLDWMAPLSMPLFMGVEFFNQSDDGSGSFTRIVDSLTKISDPLIQLSVLTGINRLISSAKWSDNSIGSIMSEAIAGYANQYIPTFFGQVARTIDDTRRTKYFDKNEDLPKFAKIIKANTQAKIPLWSQDAPAYIDSFGRTQKTGDTALSRAFQNMISPGFISKKSNDKVIKELRKMYDKTKDTTLLPPTTLRNVTVNNERIDFTAKQYEQFNKDRGKLTYNTLEKMIQTNLYKKSPEKDKIEMIAKVYNYTNQIAKAKHFDYEPQKWVLDIQESPLSDGEAIAQYLEIDNSAEERKEMKAAGKIQDMSNPFDSLSLKGEAREKYILSTMPSSAQRQYHHAKNQFNMSPDDYYKAYFAMTTKDNRSKKKVESINDLMAMGFDYNGANRFWDIQKKKEWK